MSDIEQAEENLGPADHPREYCTGHCDYHPSRPVPIRLTGCTCGGIGDTGAHSRDCPWA